MGVFILILRAGDLYPRVGGDVLDEGSEFGQLGI
jgi:hypothetical protein